MLKKRFAIHFLPILLLLVLWFPPKECFSAEPSSIDSYFYPAKDAYVYEQVNTNSGGYSELYVGFQKVDRFGDVRSVIQFDLSEIPENAEVINASLYAYAIDENASLNLVVIGVYPAPSPWEESGLTWAQLDNKSAQIRNSSFIKGIPGSSPGTYSWEITDIVQAWVSGDPNYGVVLKIGSEKFDDYIRLYSRENQTFKPYLNVIYKPSVPAPEGAAVSESPADEPVAAKIDEQSFPKAEADTDGGVTETGAPPDKMDQIPATVQPPDIVEPPAGPLPPVITQHPASQKKNPGNPAAFSVSASGTPPLSFQWKKDGTDIPGQTGETLAFDAVSESDGGVFTCLVENDAGSVESIAAILSVSKPVAITTQPQAASVIEGESVTFSVTAAGSPPLSFQWKKNHVDILGATSNKYTIKSIEKGHAGAYACEVNNSFSNDISAQAALDVLLPPRITRQPDSLKIELGMPAAFSVNASGTPPLSFQWKKDGTDIPGQTAETLAFDAVSESDEGVFTCLVENDAGSAESIAAMLSVNKPAAITTQPQAVSAKEGESVTFSVTAAGSPPLSFQWKKNHVDIKGATSNQYIIKSVEKGHAGIYACEVKNDFSNDMSAEATLEVLLPPRISGQPKSLKIELGMPAAFSVGASGTPPLSFQWKKDGMDIPGQTAETLTFDAASENDQGVFTCRIANRVGSIETDAARLSVIAPPEVTRQPASRMINPGESVTFSVSASGTPPLSFQWKKDGTDIPGQTAETLSLDSVSQNDEGVFICRIANDAGSIETDAARLYVANPPELTRQPEPRTVDAGKPATFSVSASGTPPLSFQWKKDGTDIPGQTADTLSIPSVSRNDAGEFACRITNAAGSIQSDAARLEVAAPPEDIPAKPAIIDQFPPRITDQPASRTADSGESVTFSVSAAGTPPLSFQWEKDGKDIPGQTADTLTIPSVSRNDAGVFTCRITNAEGNIQSDAARLSVTLPPEITIQAASQLINPGESVTFSVSASGTPPLSFQWKKDGADIPGQTADILTIPSVSQTDEGIFTCRVANSAGSVESDAAQLYVAVPPKVKRQPASQFINRGAAVTFSVSASGTPPLSFQWKKNNMDIPGATEDHYTLPSVQKNDGGVYTCDVSNDFSRVASSAAKLVIEIPAPEIPKEKAPAGSPKIAEDAVPVDSELKQKPSLAVKNLFLIGPKEQGQYVRNGNILKIRGAATSPVILVSAHLEDKEERLIRDVSKSIQIDPDTLDIQGSVFVGSFRRAGSVSLRLIVRDPESGQSSEKMSNFLLVDNDSPKIEVTEPANNASFNRAPILIQGTALDDLSGVASVEISTDGGLTYSRADFSKDGHWKYNFWPSAAGEEYTLYARSTDKSGLSSISDHLTVSYMKSQPPAPKTAEKSKKKDPGNPPQNAKKTPDDIGIQTYRITDIEHNRFKPVELFLLKEDMAIICRGYGGKEVTLKIMSSFSEEVLFELVDFIPEDKNKMWRWKLSETGNFKAALFVDGTQADEVYFKIVE